MASIIPKIRIGLAQNKKSKHNLSFDCSTTANIGSVQPTMCREMIPGEKFKVKQSSLVRLYPMPVPTFGRMSLRNYHCFVPYVDLWQPFDAFMSAQHYYSNGVSYVPTAVPTFYPEDVAFRYIMSYSDISIAPANQMDRPYTITTNNVSWDGTVYPFGEGTDDGEGNEKTYEDAIRDAQAADLALIQAAWTKLRNPHILGRNTNSLSFFSTIDSNVPGDLTQEGKGVLNLGDYSGLLSGGDLTLKIAYPGVSSPNVYANSGGTAILPEGADLITRHTTQDADYFIYFKFKAPLKRFRTIFIGLGYGFQPYKPVSGNSSYNQTKQNLFKLLAYFKCWYTLFRPNRGIAFVDTEVYKFIKYISENANSATHFEASSTQLQAMMQEIFKSCYYYLPMDYFSMAVVKPQAQMTSETSSLNSNAFSYASGDNNSHIDPGDLGKVDVYGISNKGSSTPPTVNILNVAGAQNPMVQKMAQRLLTWANKNTVIGRSVRDYLRVHFGITDTNYIDQDGIYRIGSSRININISDVMSQAETSEGALGEYAGRGIGYGDSEVFDFEADKFGVWITLTVIVPESGYYQGYLRENRQQTRFDFFNPEFDALGYQTIERGEVMNDWNCDNGSQSGSTWNPSADFAPTVAFGFVPRYSHLKVGRNIVNGDLSLVGMYQSMAPYTLDRRFSAGVIKNTAMSVAGTPIRELQRPSYLPTIVYDDFRKIDPSDHLGQYNRVFNYQLNDLDHFIIHNIFDVTAFAPMKSLSESFDTITSDDDGSTEITHS